MIRRYTNLLACGICPITGKKNPGFDVYKTGEKYGLKARSILMSGDDTIWIMECGNKPKYILNFYPDDKKVVSGIPSIGHLVSWNVEIHDIIAHGARRLVRYLESMPDDVFFWLSGNANTTPALELDFVKNTQAYIRASYGNARRLLAHRYGSEKANFILLMAPPEIALVSAFAGEKSNEKIEKGYHLVNAMKKNGFPIPFSIYNKVAVKRAIEVANLVSKV